MKEYRLIHLKDDQHFQGDWDLVLPLCEKEHHDKFINPRIHEAFAKHEAKHDNRYFVHVATGPHHASDNWTVIFEVKGHKAELIKIEPGFNSYLGHEHNWLLIPYISLNSSIDCLHRVIYFLSTKILKPEIKLLKLDQQKYDSSYKYCYCTKHALNYWYQRLTKIWFLFSSL